MVSMKQSSSKKKAEMSFVRDSPHPSCRKREPSLPLPGLSDRDTKSRRNQDRHRRCHLPVGLISFFV